MKQGSNIKSRGRNRRNLPVNSQPINVNASLSGIVKGGLTLTGFLSVPCTLDGVPRFQSAGPLPSFPIAALMISPSEVRLTYQTAQTTASTLTVPANDPALRTFSGGFINGGVISI